MKKIIIALAVTLIMVLSVTVSFAQTDTQDGTAQIIRIPSKRVSTIAETLDSAPALLGGAGSAGGGGGAGSVPSTGGAVTEPDDDYEDYGKIYISSAYCDNFYLNNNTFDISVSFDWEEYIADARTNLKLNVYEVIYDNEYYEEPTLNLVASTIDANYDLWNDASIKYTLQILPGVEVSTDSEYQVEFEYAGNASLSSDMKYFYVFADDSDRVTDYKIIDKSTATIEVEITNFDADTPYYAYSNNSDKYYYPVNTNGNILTFCFEDLVDKSFDWNTIVIGYISFHKDDNYIDDDYEDYPHYTDSFIGEIDLQYECDSKVDFNDIEWNGLEVYGPVADGAKEFIVDIYSAEDSEGTSANGNGGYYKEADAENIKVELYNETLGTKIDTQVELETYRIDDKYSEVDDTVCFGAFVYPSAPLTDNYTYYIVVDDGMCTRMKEVLVTKEPSLSYITLNGSTSDGKYNSEFKKAKVYEVSLDNAINMPDINKLDAKFITKGGKDIAVLDRTTISVEQCYGASNISFNMNSIAEPDINEREHYLAIYYDGKYITTSRLYFRDDNEYNYDDEIHYGLNIYNSYKINDEKLVIIAGVCTNDENFDINNYEFEFYADCDHETPLDGGRVAKLYKEWDTTYYLWEYDVSGVVQNYDNYVFKYNFTYEDTYTFGVQNYSYTDSVVYDIRYMDGDKLYIYGYNLPYGDWRLQLSDEDKNKPFVFEGTTKTNYMIEFDISNKPKDVMQRYAVLEVNNKFMQKIDFYEFSYINPLGKALYSEFYSQNSRIAIFNLPYELYTQYKIASSAKELENMNYSAMKNQIVKVLDNINGAHYIYAQFKDANGNETDIIKTKVILEKSTPKLEFYTDLSGTYYTENFYIQTPISVDRAGYLYYQLYSKDGLPIEYSQHETVYEDTTQLSRHIWISSDQDTLDMIDRIDFWLEDKAGNKSEVLSYNIEAKSRYTYYYVGNGYIWFDTIERKILSIYNISGNLTIPSQIAGVPVEKIDNGAISSCPELISISIPSTVISIGYYSFNGYSNLIFYVKENSYAHNILSSYSYNVVVSANPGDINNDKVVNGADLLRLAKYFADWDVEINFETADVNADGDVTVADLLRLAKYIAGHSVTLGE